MAAKNQPHSPVMLAGYKGPASGFVQRTTELVIQNVTNSPYSHVELVVNKYCYSSSQWDGGVRKKRIHLEPEKWDLVPLPWVSPAQVHFFYGRTSGDGYDFLGLRLFLGFAGEKDTDFAKWWCSEWCAAAVGLHDTRVSPGRLMRWAVEAYAQYLLELREGGEASGQRT